MSNTTTAICKPIDEYLEIVENGIACNDQKLLAAYIRKCFKSENIYTDVEQLNKYLGLVKYFPYERLFEWEAFCIALHLCTFWRDTGQPRWPDLFLLIGRGAGKDGFIAIESLCLASPYSGLPQYDVDICANAEEQAMRPVNDLLAVLDDAQHRKKLKRHFYWTKQKIVGLKTKAAIKGRTNNPKSKDGMRSGIVIFNEIHQYQNYDNIKVFITGLGKKKHPRRLYATSNGDVRQGPLDDLLARNEQILKGEIGDNGLLPFVCRLDNKTEVDNPEMWVKANPSLPYLPDLQTVIEKEYVDWKENPIANADFMTKRMNLPQSDAEVAITDWENIIATKRDLPDLTGWRCVGGIDYASRTDFASVNLHFLDGDIRYDINHSWLCLQSKDLHRLTIDWRSWAELGYITLVDDVEIHPDLIAAWIAEAQKKYIIEKLALDDYKHTILRNSLSGIGFDAKERKNLKIIRPSDLMKAHFVIESVFVNQNFVWGENPPLRWATNNTKLCRSPAGNLFYGKIEAKSRKTDPFMALAASVTLEEELDGASGTYDDIPVIIG